MRLDISYRMNFQYDAPVWESQNEIRARPRSDDRQQVVARRLVTAPTSKVMAFVDYWGTTVHHVGVREPHMAFEIVAEAAVETSAPEPLTVDPGLDSVVAPEFSLAHAEFLTPSVHTNWSPEVQQLAMQASTQSSTVPELISAVVQTVREQIAYQSGTTEIGVSLADLLRGGAGVCQDFAHLTIGMFRSIGVPARYVSGFLFATDETAVGPDEEEEEIVRVQTHAWVEVAVPGHGWFAIDPTNDVPVAAKHAVIGHGRDYDDVAPVKGVFVGDARPVVQSEVVIERMAPASRSVITGGPRRLDHDEMARHQQETQQQQ